jgi:hypothetical protein
MSNKNKISTKLTIFGGRIFAVAALVAFATVGTAFAETITKSFEFGPGTALTHANVRTFPVPCGLPVKTKATFTPDCPN